MEDRNSKVGFGTLSLEARKHPVDARIDLAYSLLQSVDDQKDPEYERLWMEEIERRCREFEAGRVEAIPVEEVLAKLRAKLASVKREPEIRETTKIVKSFDEIKRDSLQLPVDEQLDLAYAILRDLQSDGILIDWDRPEVVGRSRESLPINNETA